MVKHLHNKHNNIPATIYEIVFANPSNFFPVYSTSVGLTYPTDPDADAYFAALSVPSAPTDVMTQTANFMVENINQVSDRKTKKCICTYIT